MAEDKSTTTTVAKKQTETESKSVEKTEEGAAQKTSSKKSKRKVKRSVAVGQVHIKATFNNTIITVTDKQGNVLTGSSAGSSGFRGSKKGTAYAAQIASEKAVSDAKQKFGLKQVDVFVKGIGLGRDAAIRALLNVDVTVDSIKDVIGIPHGGVRPRKSKKG